VACDARSHSYRDVRLTVNRRRAFVNNDNTRVHGGTMTDHAITIRAATPFDDDALAALTTLDNRRRPSGRALVAEADGTPIAAIALTSGAVLAAAGSPNMQAIHALKYGRYRLLRQGGDVAPAWRQFRRRALPSAASGRATLRSKPCACPGDEAVRVNEERSA
jgi:hypothetical protein